MTLDQFQIGAEFLCNEHRWRCTDIGTRVIVAVSMGPWEINHDGKIVLSDDSSWLNGPPYAITETVFDEYDLEGCEVPSDNSVIKSSEKSSDG